jgi:hypothetical protein
MEDTQPSRDTRDAPKLEAGTIPAGHAKMGGEDVLKSTAASVAAPSGSAISLTAAQMAA